MATEKQIAANRRNAQLSTGPRSAEGKAAASRNALKTGLYARGIIIGHENSAQLEALEAQFTAEYQPATPTERSLVDSLIHLEWMLRRYRWLETETWHATQDQLTTDQMQSTWTGHAFILQPAISRIHRLRSSTQRQFRETLAELRALQAERAASADPEPEPTQPIENTPDTPEIGFVPSDSLAPATPAGARPVPGPDAGLASPGHPAGVPKSPVRSVSDFHYRRFSTARRRNIISTYRPRRATPARCNKSF